MRKGLDCAAPALGSLQAARNAGIDVLIRYLWHGAKGTTIRELRAASALGFDCVLVYEAGGNAVLDGTSGGRVAAADIERLMAGLGLGPEVPVYGTSVDFPATPSEVGGPILDYASALAASVHSGRPTGAYGQGSVHMELLGTVTQLAWVWGVNQSAGTQAFLATGRWHIHQHPTVRGFGIEYDPDDAQDAGFGGFRVPVLMQLGDHGDDIRLLQHYLGLAGPQCDGSFGPQTAASLGRWIAARGRPQSAVVDDTLWKEISAPVA